jgi:hypothetical protein
MKLFYFILNFDHEKVKQNVALFSKNEETFHFQVY